MWCIAHRLELAVKDALKGTALDVIDEFLLRLYYLYEKSPNKCRELEDLITDLRTEDMLKRWDEMLHSGSH